MRKQKNLVRLKVFFDVQGESELQGRLELGKQRLLESRCDIIFPSSILGKSSKPIGSAGMEGSTDVYIYGVDAQEQLVKTDEMIR